MPGQLRRWHNLIQTVTDQCPEDNNQAKKSGHDESLCFASARSRRGSRRLQTGGKLTQAGFSTIEIKTHVIHGRSEEHTAELQSRGHLVCRLLLEKKKN